MENNHYFLHKSNSKDDHRCILLIEELGMEGYGIFWVLIELLYSQPECKYPVQLLPAIARKYNTTEDKIKRVVMDYKLFQTETISGKEFFLHKNLE